MKDNNYCRCPHPMEVFKVFIQVQNASRGLTSVPSTHAMCVLHPLSGAEQRMRILFLWQCFWPIARTRQDQFLMNNRNQNKRDCLISQLCFQSEWRKRDALIGNQLMVTLQLKANDTFGPRSAVVLRFVLQLKG